MSAQYCDACIEEKVQYKCRISIGMSNYFGEDGKCSRCRHPEHAHAPPAAAVAGEHGRAL